MLSMPGELIVLIKDGHPNLLVYILRIISLKSLALMYAHINCVA